LETKTSTKELTYNADDFKQVASGYVALIANAANAEVARERLYRRITRHQFDTHADQGGLSEAKVIRVRDSSRALRGILKSRSDQVAGFSVIQAIYDIVKDTPRPELQPGFYTDLVHMFMGMRGEGPAFAFGEFYVREGLEGREAAIARSRHLDRLWVVVEKWMDRRQRKRLERLEMADQPRDQEAHRS
jgi:lysine 2,3-aminomutase